MWFSIQSLVLIAGDRFIAIVFLLKVLKITAKIRAVFVLLIWVLPVYAGLYSILCLQ